MTTRRTQLAWVGAAWVLLALLVFGISFRLINPAWQPTITLGGTTMDLGSVLVLPILIAVKVLFFVSWVLFVFQAFKAHWGWDLAILCLPMVAVAFYIPYHREAKLPAIFFATGLGLLLIVFICTEIY